MAQPHAVQHKQLVLQTATKNTVNSWKIMQQ